MNIQSYLTQTWSDSFFNLFTNCRSEIYENHLDFVKEDISDIFKLLSYKQNWLARIWTIDEKPVARYLFSHTKSSNTLYFGFFECVKNEFVEEKIKQEVFKDIALLKQDCPSLNEIIGPIQVSLFYGGRFREASENSYFFSEPLYLDHYPILWESWGFRKKRKWISYSLNPKESIEFYKNMNSKYSKIWKSSKIKMRPIEFKDSDLKAIYDITIEAYNFKNTNDEIDFKTFKRLALKAQPAIEKKLSQFLIYDDKIAGFVINYIDIQNEIRKFNKIIKRHPLLKPFLKIKLLIDLKLKKHPLILMYVAKSKNCPVRMAMGYLATNLSNTVNKSDYSYWISAYNEDNSKGLSSLPDNKKIYSNHFLMYKDIDE